ncbi:protein of unknown function [Propionibacterium freudenreichii]|nr:protein of unknown function [Propionibacterium freudenreichii]CEH01268.1 Protein of unknown function [Propionibacterium freudenreichii]
MTQREAGQLVVHGERTFPAGCIKDQGVPARGGEGESQRAEGVAQVVVELLALRTGHHEGDHIRLVNPLTLFEAIGHAKALRTIDEAQGGQRHPTQGRRVDRRCLRDGRSHCGSGPA